MAWNLSRLGLSVLVVYISPNSGRLSTLHCCCCSSSTPLPACADISKNKIAAVNLAVAITGFTLILIANKCKHPAQAQLLVHAHARIRETKRACACAYRISACRVQYLWREIIKIVNKFMINCQSRSPVA